MPTTSAANPLVPPEPSPAPPASPAVPTLDELERLMQDDSRVFRGVDWQLSDASDWKRRLRAQVRAELYGR
jgi:hypothetical protein